jgi:glyceraldehyde-3-phosphate dehydrogenase (ferredoxin)
VESPHFLGPVEFAWGSRDENDPTILGAGPLAGLPVPGANALIIAGRSLLWDGFYSTRMEGGGALLGALGCPLISLRGRAARPSVLVITRQQGEVQVRVDPLEPEPLWQGTHDGEGLFALLFAIAARYEREMDHLRILAVGPAAERTRFGAIGSVGVEGGVRSPHVCWFRRGGFGSRLYQVHRLCGVVFGDATGRGETAAQRESDGGSFDRFRRDMSLEELGEVVNFEWNPKQLAAGELGATLQALRDRVLWFNASSIYLSVEERGDLYRRAIRDHYLTHVLESSPGSDQHVGCGGRGSLQRCTLSEARSREFEPSAALGPQLGIAHPPAMDRLIRHCESLGLDTNAASGILGWLMERLSGGLEDPLELGLRSRPRWSARDFDPVSDSVHNAEIAQTLASGLLFAPWGAPLRQGLRVASRATPAASSSMAVYIANGESGEIVPNPSWASGFYAPMPISGEFFSYYGLDFLPPRVLGRKSAQRMIAELMLQNFGVCRFHRGWAEALFPELVNQRHGMTIDWVAHHRGLARRIYRRRKVRFWETERVVDIIASYLKIYQYETAPDAELDRWVRRFRENKASAARAFWSEINAGLEEIFGA